MSPGVGRSTCERSWEAASKFSYKHSSQISSFLPWSKKKKRCLFLLFLLFHFFLILHLFSFSLFTVSNCDPSQRSSENDFNVDPFRVLVPAERFNYIGIYVLLRHMNFLHKVTIDLFSLCFQVFQKHKSSLITPHVIVLMGNKWRPEFYFSYTGETEELRLKYPLKSGK